MTNNIDSFEKLNIFCNDRGFKCHTLYNHSDDSITFRIDRNDGEFLTQFNLKRECLLRGKYYIDDYIVSNLSAMFNYNNSEKNNGGDIKMVNVNKVCDTCCKEDVCSYKELTMIAVNDQVDIINRKNVFLKASTECEKWLCKPEMTPRMDEKSN